MEKRTKKDLVCYVLLEINPKGKEVIYGSDTQVTQGVLNDNPQGLFLLKQPRNINDGFCHKAFVPKGTIVLKEGKGTLKVTRAHISTHCIAKYGMWVDEQ